MIGRINIRVRELDKETGKSRNYNGGGASYDQGVICAGLCLEDDYNRVFSDLPDVEEKSTSLPIEKTTVALDNEKAEKEKARVAAEKAEKEKARVAAEKAMKALFSENFSENNRRILNSSYTCEHDGEPHYNMPCLERRGKECDFEQAVRVNYDGNITPAVLERINRHRILAGLGVKD